MSSSFALAKAEVKRGSVRQLVTCWAIAARLQNAVVTARQVSLFVESASTKVFAL